MAQVPSGHDPEVHTSSVVVDPDAVVEKSHLVQIIAGVVVAGLIAFTIVYFATRTSVDDYKAGPAAQAVVNGLAVSKITLHLSGAELKCIDRTFAGFDTSAFATGFDPFNNTYDSATLARAGKMMDECLTQTTRVQLMTQSMTVGGFASGAKADCAAKAFDGVVRKAGGYAKVFADDQATAGVANDLATVFTTCGVDLSSATGDTTLDTTDSSPCDAELSTIEAAIEAYFGDKGVDATSYRDLVPTYLKVDPSARFKFVAGDGSNGPTLVGVGACTGYGN